MNPMVGEVNKIVYNLLAAEHVLCIPSVGSLCVKRQPAKPLSKGRIMPPCYTVVFTSQVVGRSLTEALAREAGCSTEEAQEVCRRWLSRVMQGDVLTIEGVGVLRGKGFLIDPAFDKVLNPSGCAPMAVRAPHSHWFFWMVASVAIVCGTGVCGWILYDRMGEEWFGTRTELRAEVATEPVPRRVVPVATLPIPEVIDSLSASSDQTAAVSQEQAVSDLISERMVSGRTYVVLGVFSTEQNALRAAKNAQVADPSLRSGVYYYGTKYMVSLFASDDAEACGAFRRANVARYPDAWSYKAGQ